VDSGYAIYPEVFSGVEMEALSAVLLALRIHLDESNEDNGPLRVIPGSHGVGVLTDHEVSASAARVVPITCVVGRGGVVAMRPLIIHASSKARGDPPRRVLHIEYAPSLELERGLKLQLA
jgi:ectoine hydroxylase-related dioxygenase (phytanoyl-CoA dioxygenase family)